MHETTAIEATGKTHTRRPVFAFLHIPKTAGSSFSDIVFSEYSDWSGRVEDDGGFNQAVLYTDKYTYPEGFFTSATLSETLLEKPVAGRSIGALLGHFDFSVARLLPSGANYVTFLRDPVERVLSLVAHLRRWRDNYVSLDGQARYAPYLAIGASNGDDFLRIAEDHQLPEFSNDQLRRCSVQPLPFAAPVSEYYERIPAALGAFRVIGVSERFEDSVRAIARTLGWTTQLYFPKTLLAEDGAKDALRSERIIETLRTWNALDRAFYDAAKARLPTYTERKQ